MGSGEFRAARGRGPLLGLFAVHSSSGCGGETRAVGLAGAGERRAGLRV